MMLQTKIAYYYSMIVPSLLILSILVSLLARTTTAGDVVSNSQSFFGIGDIHYTYYYDDDDMVDETSSSSSSSSCETIIYLGVGTAMANDAYGQMTEKIVTTAAAGGNNNIIVIVGDHNPWRMIKLFDDDFSDLVNYVHDNLYEIMPEVCNNNNNNTEYRRPDFIIGGHSASGRAALMAIEKSSLSFQPVGFIGFDPYWVSGEEDTLEIPSLNYGFTEGTCGVDPNMAAKALYSISNDSYRVYYEINNADNDINHCVFADSGCPFCGQSVDDSMWVHDAIGQGVVKFVEAIRTGDTATFNEVDFKLEPTKEEHEMTVFVNDDAVAFGYD